MNDGLKIAAATDARLLKRTCESLLGISAGLVADGELNSQEIQFLSTWLSENRALAESWPGEVIFKRVRDVLEDGVITDVERAYLLETLTQLVGGSFFDDGSVPVGASQLPIDRDVIYRKVYVRHTRFVRTSD
jgi:polyhydroxyalkanoate synthesis regulator phasin